MLPPYSRSILGLKFHHPCQPLFQGCQVENPQSNGLCGPYSVSILNLSAVLSNSFWTHYSLLPYLLPQTLTFPACYLSIVLSPNFCLVVAGSPGIGRILGIPLKLNFVGTDIFHSHSPITPVDEGSGRLGAGWVILEPGPCLGLSRAEEGRSGAWTGKGGRLFTIFTVFPGLHGTIPATIF